MKRLIVVSLVSLISGCGQMSEPVAELQKVATEAERAAESAVAEAEQAAQSAVAATGQAIGAAEPLVPSNDSGVSAFMMQFEGLWRDENSGGGTALVVLDNALVLQPLNRPESLIILEPNDVLDGANHQVTVRARSVDQSGYQNQAQKIASSLERMETSAVLADAQTFESFSEENAAQWLEWLAGKRELERYVADLTGNLNDLRRAAANLGGYLTGMANQSREWAEKLNPQSDENQQFSTMTLRDQGIGAGSVQPAIISDSGSMWSFGFIRKLTEDEKQKVRDSVTAYREDAVNPEVQAVHDAALAKAQAFEQTAQRLNARAEEASVWYRGYLERCLADGKMREGDSLESIVYNIENLVPMCE